MKRWLHSCLGNTEEHSGVLSIVSLKKGCFKKIFKYLGSGRLTREGIHYVHISTEALFNGVKF